MKVKRNNSSESLTNDNVKNIIDILRKKTAFKDKFGNSDDEIDLKNNSPRIKQLSKSLNSQDDVNLRLDYKNSNSSIKNKNPELKYDNNVNFTDDNNKSNKFQIERNNYESNDSIMLTVNTNFSKNFSSKDQINKFEDVEIQSNYEEEKEEDVNTNMNRLIERVSLIEKTDPKIEKSPNNDISPQTKKNDISPQNIKFDDLKNKQKVNHFKLKESLRNKNKTSTTNKIGEFLKINKNFMGTFDLTKDHSNNNSNFKSKLDYSPRNVTNTNQNNIKSTKILGSNQSKITNKNNTNQTQSKSKQQVKSKLLQHQLPKTNEFQKQDIPDEFICPLSKTIMLNPYSTKYGVSQQKEAIEEYVKQNHKDYQTASPCKVDEIFPNLTLHKLIDNQMRNNPLTVFHLIIEEVKRRQVAREPIPSVVALEKMYSLPEGYLAEWLVSENVDKVLGTVIDDQEKYERNLKQIRMLEQENKKMLNSYSMDADKFLNFRSSLEERNSDNIIEIIQSNPVVTMMFFNM